MDRMPTRRVKNTWETRFFFRSELEAELVPNMYNLILAQPSGSIMDGLRDVDSVAT
jgi:hypothetical protein